MQVLEWLQEANLRSYAPLFVRHNLDSLNFVRETPRASARQTTRAHDMLVCAALDDQTVRVVSKILTREAWPGGAVRKFEERE